VGSAPPPPGSGKKKGGGAGSPPPPTSTSTSTGLHTTAFDDSAAGWAYGFLKFIGASGGIGNVKQAYANPRIQFLMAWMQKEGIFTTGNPYNPLAIEYHGSTTQEKKRWNPNGVSRFSSRATGYAALQDYINGYGKGPFAILSALQQTNVNLAGLQSALTATDWPGGGGAAAADYAASVMSDLSGDAQYQARQESGNFAGSGPVGSTSSTAAPKAPPKVLENLGNGQYGIRNQTVASKYSAFETLQNYLSIYFTNLSRPEMHALTDWAYQKTVTNGEDYDQTLVALRQTPWYAKVFPGNVDRMKQGQPLLTEAEYRSLEDNLRGQAANAGLPSGFIEKWIPKFIASNVSPTVVSQRLASALQLAGTTDVKVRQEFQRMFGVKGGIGAIAAYFIDPKHASGLIAQQANAAEYGALSAQSGLGELSRAQAMNLSASRVEKVYGTGAIRSAIQDSAFYKNLTGAAPGSNESTVTAGQLLGSRLTGFDANQAKDAAAVRNAESARESQTQAGGGFAPNATGLTGVGHASDEGVGRA
jgi:hypothetical protein